MEVWGQGKLSLNPGLFQSVTETVDNIVDPEDPHLPFFLMQKWPVLLGMEGDEHRDCCPACEGKEWLRGVLWLDFNSSWVVAASSQRAIL